MAQKKAKKIIIKLPTEILSRDKPDKLVLTPNEHKCFIWMGIERKPSQVKCGNKKEDRIRECDLPITGKKEKRKFIDKMISFGIITKRCIAKGSEVYALNDVYYGIVDDKNYSIIPPFGEIKKNLEGEYLFKTEFIVSLKKEVALLETKRKALGLKREKFKKKIGVLDGKISSTEVEDKALAKEIEEKKQMLNETNSDELKYLKGKIKAVKYIAKLPLQEATSLLEFIDRAKTLA